MGCNAIKKRSKMKRLIVLLFFINFTSAFCQAINFTGEPELFAPGIISIEKSEVKITFSKEGNLALWGEIGREKGIGGLDIWQSEKTKDGWSDPKPVSFNSTENDFDPSFSADGKTVYFFSNRYGGLGGDDLYYVQYDSAAQTFSNPVNMGARFNSPKDEWGPVESVDGNKFIFCSDGFGGKGMHDVFICERTTDGWGVPKNIETINYEGDDFDPVLLHDCKTILFTRKVNEDEAYLYLSYLTKNGYTIPEKISDKINATGTWNFGSSISTTDPSYIYYSSHIKDNSKGRLDIYRIKYKIAD